MQQRIKHIITFFLCLIFLFRLGAPVYAGMTSCAHASSAEKHLCCLNKVQEKSDSENADSSIPEECVEKASCPCSFKALPNLPETPLALYSSNPTKEVRLQSQFLPVISLFLFAVLQDTEQLPVRESHYPPFKPSPRQILALHATLLI